MQIFCINKNTWRIDTVAYFADGDPVPAEILWFITHPFVEGFWVGDYYDPATGTFYHPEPTTPPEEEESDGSI